MNAGMFGQVGVPGLAQEGLLVVEVLGRVGEDFRRQATPQLSPTERLVAFWCDRRPQNSVFSRDAE